MIVPPHRPAVAEDAGVLAELVNMAGDGLPAYLWSRLAEAGEDAWDVGRRRAARETGSFSYRNAIVREQAGRVIAALIGYALPDHPEATDYTGMPAMFVPLQQLEDLAPGTWYINVLATLPEFRGRGHGAELLSIAESLAIETARHGMSLIVSDGNPAAIRFYVREGYSERARRPIVRNGWQCEGNDWVLMTKPLRR